MNYTKRQAGQSTYEMAARRHKSRVWLLVAVLGVGIVVSLLIFNSKALGISGLGIIALVVTARLAMDYGDVREQKMYKEERRAVRGARGEETIGSILESLGEGFLVIHDIESPYGNIDHVVISEKAGVFLIETKSHSGRVSMKGGKLALNGRDPEKNFIAQVLKNTYWLRDQIQRTMNVQPWITPVLVFTGAFVEPMRPIKGVTVVNKKFLPNVLRPPNARQQNAMIWNNRDRIEQVL